MTHQRKRITTAPPVRLVPVRDALISATQMVVEMWTDYRKEIDDECLPDLPDGHFTDDEDERLVAVYDIGVAVVWKLVSGTSTKLYIGNADDTFGEPFADAFKLPPTSIKTFNRFFDLLTGRTISDEFVFVTEEPRSSRPGRTGEIVFLKADIVTQWENSRALKQQVMSDFRRARPKIDFENVAAVEDDLRRYVSNYPDEFPIPTRDQLGKQWFDARTIGGRPIPQKSRRLIRRAALPEDWTRAGRE